MILIIITLLLSLLLQADNLGNLTGVLQPESIQVDGDELYVVEKARIFVYSLKNLQLLRKFGREGDGPGELKVFPFWPNSITILPDSIFAEGLYKFIYFSKEGQLIKEQKKSQRLFKLLPVGKNIVARTFPFEGDDKKQYMAIKVLNPQLKEIKELYREPVHMLNTEGLITMIPDSANFCVYDEKIFIEESPGGFVIEVFDSEGKKLYDIKKNDEKTRVTEDYKKTAMEYLKESFLRKKVTVFVPINVVESGWDAFRKWAKLVYPDYLPPIQDIVVDSGKIYAQTYKRQGDKEEFVIMDLKGNILDKVYLPRMKNHAVYDYQMLGIGVRFYAISNNRFIYLNENEDTEEWEVHMTAIKLATKPRSHEGQK